MAYPISCYVGSPENFEAYSIRFQHSFEGGVFLVYVEPTGGESHSFNYCYEQGVKAFSFGHKKETKTGLFVGVFISMFIRC